jgi:hypothetical protein
MSIFPQWLNWLEGFFRTSKKLGLLPPGDYDADTYVSIAVVVISTALTKSRLPDFLARLTGLPIRFVRTILSIMDDVDLWSYPEYKCLWTILDQAPVNPLVSIESLSTSVMYTFWEAPELMLYIDRLNQQRRGYVLGGDQRRSCELTEWRSSRQDLWEH